MGLAFCHEKGFDSPGSKPRPFYFLGDLRPVCLSSYHFESIQMSDETPYLVA